MTSDIEKILIEGNLKFKRKILEELESIEIEGKVPRYPVLILTCMDPRIDIHRIFQLKPGDVFVLRNAGNIFSQDTFRSILMAIYQYRIKYIIILGHLDCGMTKMNLLELKKITPREFYPQLSRKGSDIFSETRIFYKPFNDEIRNLKKQVENFQNLKQYIPELVIIGMLYDPKSGWVFTYNDFMDFAYVENFENQRKKVLREKEYRFSSFLKTLNNQSRYERDEIEIKDQTNQEQVEITQEILEEEEEEPVKFAGDNEDLNKHEINFIMPKIRIPKINFPGVKIYIPKVSFRNKSRDN
ncbi:MAG: carbonic anhydrase [Promethearchaeota archaeon]